MLCNNTRNSSNTIDLQSIIVPFNHAISLFISLFFVFFELKNGDAFFLSLSGSGFKALCFLTDYLINLLAEGATFGQTALAAARPRENSAATGTEDSSLGMGKHSGDVEAARALDIHEEAVGALN